MEVHLNNLPEHLPENALHKYLEPFTAKLGIPSHAFSCEKLKKRKWANVTFGDPYQGRLFLEHHGEQLVYANALAAWGSAVSGARFANANPGPSRPRRMARLRLLGNDVFCKMSKNPYKPDAGAGEPHPITLRGLKHAAEEHVKPTHKTRPETSPETFSVASLSCGHNIWHGDKLVFVPEVEFQDTGIAKFSKKILLIKLQSKRVIKVPLDTVVDIVCSFGHILTLTLLEQPSFFEDIDELADQFSGVHISADTQNLSNEPTRSRVCSLEYNHAQVAGQCLVYQIQVSGPDLARRLQILKTHDVLSSIFTRFDMVTQRTPPLDLGSSRLAMRNLEELLADYTRTSALPFGILFQLQALAWNAYLHPGTVYALAKELCRLHKIDRAAGRRSVSVDALKALFKQINWPTPNGDPSEFKVASIIALLRTNDDNFSQNIALRQGSHLPSHNLALVHRATVTPSRITLHGPELEAKNRILRKFPEHHEFFIRVQFCDENGLDLYFNPKINSDEVYSRFEHVLKGGLQIAGRTYSFLGFSHSSLRSHSAWVC